MSLNVLLTNDDGPPNPGESPYILGLYQCLTKDLNWNVKVVIPNAQKSWIGNSYHITQATRGWYFYPRDDGQGEASNYSRPLRNAEIAEWILLDATPATCANIALHNLYPGQIDLVISGPNFGRNVSAALAMSSGTLGAALTSSLSKIRSIALSYGTVVKPTPVEWFQPAHALSCRILQYLWNNWEKDEGGARDGEVDLYSVNIPMIEGLLSNEGLEVCRTSIWRNSCGRLFKNIALSKSQEPKKFISATGPDAFSNDDASIDKSSSSESGDLLFTFSPDLSKIIEPALINPPIGSDGWAIKNGCASVTPLRASFAEPPTVEGGSDGRIWKMKL